MKKWVSVVKKGELVVGEGKYVEVGDRQLALFLLGDRVYAIDNLCPHRAGPLAAGCVEDNVVLCPWHGWKFDIRTGKSPENPAAFVECFSVKIEGEDVWVEVEEG